MQARNNDRRRRDHAASWHGHAARRRLVLAIATTDVVVPPPAADYLWDGWRRNRWMYRSSAISLVIVYTPVAGGSAQ